MIRLIKACALLLLPCAALAQGLEDIQQLIVVTSKNWDDIQAPPSAMNGMGAPLKNSRHRFR
ncbi:hypothetical protein [Pseudomonas sp. ERMR1:02]|uniref:hypothetical protein n=1 Tax=unclassified Pseudomonas TaxID=196821 RepID=UPI00268AF486